VIDYETFCKIHDCHHRQGLTIAQTARSLGLHRSTVATWLARARFAQRRSQPRPSKLDPFKPGITRLLDTHPYSAQQIFQRLREEVIAAASASCAITSAAFDRLSARSI
jgi:transposase